MECFIMAETTAAILTVEDAAAFIRSNGKIDDVTDSNGHLIGAKIKLEKTKSEELMTRAGAPAAMVDTVEKARALLDRALYAVAVDECTRVVKDIKETKAIEFKDIRVHGKAIVGSSHDRVRVAPISFNKAPGTGNPVTTYCSSSMTVDISRCIPKEDIEKSEARMRELLG